MIEMGNFVNCRTGEYIKITDDPGEIEFRTELFPGNNHKKYHQVRSGICVDDIQLSGKSKVHVKKQGTAELDRVKRRATHGGPVTGTGVFLPIPRKYGDPVGPTPVSPRPRKTPVNGGPVQTRSPVNGDGEPP